MNYETELKNNYLSALSQKYNAICLDIDGTLTKGNSKEIDNRVLPIIANLLKKHIPVVFITGRGETGLNELKLEVINKLKDVYHVNNKDLLKIFVLVNDGARLFMSRKNSKDLLDISEYTINKDSFDELKEIDKKINQSLFYDEISKNFVISYSKDLKSGDIINIRFKLLNNDRVLCSKMVEKINQIINGSNYNSINITTGIHNGNQIIQVGCSTKSIAIQIAEHIIGIPQNSMLRIGDCGNLDGNDYSMLDCSQGFSVDKVSGNVDRCFPIFDRNGNILKGVNATIALINQAKLLPTICLEHASEKEYLKDYSGIEKQMNLGRIKAISSYNLSINSNFELIGGIYDLFDINSGSIKLPMYEFFCIDEENPLKKFWLHGNEKSLYNAMYDNENILLRGSNNYYYFLSQRKRDETTKEEILSKDMVTKWLNNYNEFFLNAKSAVLNTNNCEDCLNKKMVLGIFDNIRNYLLIILNQLLVNTGIEENIMLNLDKTSDNSLLRNIYNSLLKVDSIMASMCFDKNFIFDKNDFCLLINKVILLNNCFASNFSYEKEKDNYSKDFRVYREIDNFAENYITCSLISKKDVSIKSKGMCGLSYGGIELPIIMKAINPNISNISILKFNNGVNGYSKKQSVDLRFFDIKNLGGLKTIDINNDIDYYLLDDNLLTGKTMQIALTSLYDTNINVDKIVVVKYPKVNRVFQMFLPNHGAVDYRQFFNFIEGLYFSSPYSWKDLNSTSIYEDSLGVFDVNRRKILECLVKNGDYAAKSEVELIKRMVKK